MSTDITDIQLDQYKMLREEVMDLIHDTRKLEIQVISVLGALYVWLATHQSVPIATWYIGVLFSVLGAIRSYTLAMRIDVIAGYMRLLEAEWLEKHHSQKLPGWENYFFENNRWQLRYVAVPVWILILAISIIVPGYIQWHPQTLKQSQEPTEIRIVK